MHRLSITCLIDHMSSQGLAKESCEENEGSSRAQGALASKGWQTPKSHVQPRQQKRDRGNNTGIQIQLCCQESRQWQLLGGLQEGSILGGHLILPAECSSAPPQPGGTRTSLEQVLLAGPSTLLLKNIPQNSQCLVALTGMWSPFFN